MNLEQSLRENFARYAAMSIQERAIIDVRDGLKPSARQGLYAQYIDKILPDKKYQKAQKSVASAMSHFYVHGDTSIYSLLMRYGKPFASRYLLEDVQGSVGNLIESDNQAASRYVEMRLAKLSMNLFNSIDKDTINLWFDNYDGTEQYPSVFPSLGYYNIVNGTMGIATAIASSIPQFNLREVNEALIKLLWNPEISFDEIYCIPDFATGAILINEDEVKESLRQGNGKACKLRSVVTYDSKENCLLVTEIPYGVYTNTICAQLEKIVNEENNTGIERFLDLTGETPLIKIYLTKKANPEAVIRKLYKDTSLQYHFGINMVMLRDGKVPQVFGWKEALEDHLTHELSVYRKAFTFDLQKAKSRLHIVDGILIALAHIDEVVQIIRSSSNKQDAINKLGKEFGLSITQSEAILKITLARLVNIEVVKVENEKKELLKTIEDIMAILQDEVLLKKEVEKGLRTVANTYGDERRTKILNLSFTDDGDEEPTEKKSLMVSLTNLGNIYTTETSSLIAQRRGGVGNKFKLQNGEYVVETLTDTNYGTIILFSNKGRFFSYSLNNLPVNEKVNVEGFLVMDSGEKITNIVSFEKRGQKENIIFVTKQGLVKKSLLSEYNTKRTVGVQALKINSNDELCKILFVNDERISLLTSNGHLVIFETKDINAIGRIASGIKGIKLEVGDEVVSAKIIPKETKEIATITSDGLSKRTLISEISVTGRNVKGTKIQKVQAGARMADFLPINNEKEIIIVSSSTNIKIAVNEIPMSARNTQGTTVIKLNEKQQIITLTNNL